MAMMWLLLIPSPKSFRHFPSAALGFRCLFVDVRLFDGNLSNAKLKQLFPIFRFASSATQIQASAEIRDHEASAGAAICAKVFDETAILKQFDIPITRA